MSNKFLIAILFLIVISFTHVAHSQSLMSVNIVTSVHRLKLNVNITSVVPFHNRFLCLKSDGGLFFLDPNSTQVDSSINKYSTSFNFQRILLYNDTIIGAERFKNYFFDTLKKRWRPYSFKKNIYPGQLIFQDDQYFISSTCSGEWAGTIYFTNKKTLKIYESEFTCAVNVMKEPQYYNITASLSHMSGFTTVFNVKDPTGLKLYSVKRKLKESKSTKFRRVGSNESHSLIGVEKLVDTIGVTCSGSLKFKNSLLYIAEHSSFYEKPSLWIDSIKNNKLVQLQDLTNFGILEADYPQFSYNGTIITPFNNDQSSGFIYIINNRLELYIFDRRK